MCSSITGDHYQSLHTNSAERLIVPLTSLGIAVGLIGFFGTLKCTAPLMAKTCCKNGNGNGNGSGENSEMETTSTRSGSRVMKPPREMSGRRVDGHPRPE